MLPTITIARQFGSHGRDVGIQLAEALKLKYLDKELISLAAKESGFSEEIFKHADEKASSSLLYSMVMGNYPFGVRFNGVNDMPINDQLFILQMNIIKKEAEKEPCIVIGRCGNYILKDHDHVFNVFIHADKEDRVIKTMKDEGVDHKKAGDLVNKKDKERANYYNFYSDKRWEDINNYDLTINMSTFSVEEAVDLIVASLAKFR